MFTEEQEKLIERFNEHISVVHNTWKAECDLSAPYNIHLENTFRSLYTKLAPNKPNLPKAWSYQLTAISEQGDGILVSATIYWMPDGRETRTFELLIADKAYLVTKESDYEPEEHIWHFTLKAPTKEALENATKELSALLQLLPQETKSAPEKKEKVLQTESPNKTNSPVQLLSLFPITQSSSMSGLKDYLENLNNITNLTYDFSYNIAECEYDYEKIHFDFMNYSFSVYTDDEYESTKWDFYLNSGECSETVKNILVDFCKFYK